MAREYQTNVIKIITMVLPLICCIVEKGK